MAEASTRRLRVLVVDDDPDQLDLVRRTLAAQCDVQTHDSALGVTNLVRNGAWDLVLLDVNFPALKGDQVLALARKVAPPETRFILYSASDETKLRSLALACGADGYISKSVQGESLARKLISIYKKSRLPASATR